MKLGNLTTFDWVKLAGYTTAFLAFLTPDVLTTWGLSSADAVMWGHRIGTLIAFLTLASNVLKNPSPPSGTVPVLTTNSAAPTPETLTTSTAQKGP